MTGEIVVGRPVCLNGSAFERGRQQAVAFPELVESVRRAVLGRLAAVRQHMERSSVEEFLARQWAYALDHADDCMQELHGIAAGYLLEPRELFAYLHLGILQDMTCVGTDVDGCSAWALSLRRGGVLGKNRDFRGEHGALQKVFRHADPDWGGRRILTVGSLGSPGAYSSGINSDGLAIADTAVATRVHGVGMLRYFLMSKLLANCSTVSEALEEISLVRHAGGGTLVLADGGGAIAVIELGTSAVCFGDDGRAWLGRTNHFLSPELAGTCEGLPRGAMDESSCGRHARLEASLGELASDYSRDGARSLMASHASGQGLAGLCRHGEDGDALTLSGSLYECNPPVLCFSEGNPCTAPWRRYVP